MPINTLKKSGGVDLLGVHGGKLGDQETVGLGNGHLTGGCRKVGLKLQNLLSLLLSKLPKDSNTLSFKFWPIRFYMWANIEIIFVQIDLNGADLFLFVADVIHRLLLICHCGWWKGIVTVQRGIIKHKIYQYTCK